jgi:hypothetical protein
MNDIVASSVIQPAFVAAKPVASSTVAGDNLLLLTNAGTYAKIDSSTFSSSIAALLPAPEPKIWAVRLRSFNSAGNPNFEVDQRNAGALLASPASGVYAVDRWNVNYTGTMVISTQQVSPGVADTTLVVPGTSFKISNNSLKLTLTTQETTLGAADRWQLIQNIEGPLLRELIADVSSISLLVRSSVANLKFSVALRDPGATTKSLVKLCSLGAANTWTLISLPNLPVFPSGTFSLSPGAPGYSLTICLACGTTFTAPAADTWQSGNFAGAPGMSNFAANATSSTFEICMVQHEPGSQCSTFMDKPFDQNLHESQRYFDKSYEYGVKPGTADVTGFGPIWTQCQATVNPQCNVRFKRTLARDPTVIGYSSNSGNSGTVYDRLSSGDRAISAPIQLGQSGFGGFSLTTQNAAATTYSFHYSADTTW